MSFAGVKGFEARGSDIIIKPAVDSDIERVVHMNRTTHDSGSTDLEGDSIGHWEGDVPSYGATRLVERFALRKDRNQLDYSFSVENPEYISKPLTFSSAWAFRPDIKVPHLACDADVARSFLDD